MCREFSFRMILNWNHRKTKSTRHDQGSESYKNLKIPTAPCLARSRCDHLFGRENNFTAREPQPTERESFFYFVKEYSTRKFCWGVISKKGQLLLLFIVASVKIKQDYSIEHVLENYFFEHVKSIAPSHKNKCTQT
jgi:hypothetical protein